MRWLRDFDFGGRDHLPAGCGERRQLHAIHDPAAVVEHTGERRLARDVANELDACDVDGVVNRDACALRGVERRYKRHVPPQCLTAPGMHAADGGTNLRVRVRRDVLHQEINEAPVALQQCQHVRGRGISFSGLRGFHCRCCSARSRDRCGDRCSCRGRRRCCTRRHQRRGNIVWNVVAEQDGKERPDREFESSEEGGHRRHGSARENANGEIVLCEREAEPSDELSPAADKMNECGPCSGTRPLDHVGPLTRTVLDAAVLLQAIAGYNAQETTSVDRPVPALMAAIKRGPASLRVGVPRESFFTGRHSDVQTAVEQAIRVLSKLTAGVQEVVVPVNPEMHLAVMLAEGFSVHAARVREAPQLFQPPVLGHLRGGEAVGTATYIHRRRELDQVRRAAPGLFARVDLLVTPTVPLMPIPIAEVQDDEAGTALYARNTRRFNAYGLPAVSVPCGFAKNGLPIGLQIVGPPWREESVLRLAHAFEQANDAGKRRPVM